MKSNLFQIITKGHLLKYGKITHIPKYENNSFIHSNVIGKNSQLVFSSFILNVKIHQKMFSEAKLLVYYVKNDGEIVATEKNINVEECLNNKVQYT